MTILTLCGAYLRRSVVTTVLNIVLLAIGVATVVLLLIVGHDLHDRLQRDAADIDLVVGAKGSPLQIVLSSVFHVDSPTGNIPLDQAIRLREDNRIAEVIPISMGDSFAGFHIVGTEPALLRHYGARLQSGRIWQSPFEAVVGADVARHARLHEGSTFVGAHGLTGGELHEDAPYRVVGVLAPTGRVVDRLVLTGLESVWKAHEHGDDSEEAGVPVQRPREITAALVRYRSPLSALTIPREINARTTLQAASPAVEAARLFSVFGAATDILRVFAAVFVVAAALSMFAALYRAMDERKYDVAVLRMLGASRGMVIATLLAESLMLAGLGGLSGAFLGHFLASRLGSIIASAAPLASTAWRWVPEESWILLIVIISAVGAAFMPAWRAYRIDVASTLAKG